MTYKSVVMKMFRVNYKRYLYCFIGDTVGVMIFYVFMSFLTNEGFMNNPAIDSRISSNIIAPSILVGFILILLIPYSHNAFFRFRRKDYGILASIGLSQKEVLKGMLLENGMIALSSLLMGLGIGSLISILFYFYVDKILGVTGFTISFNSKAYVVTMIFYGILSIVSLIAMILNAQKTQIVYWMKNGRKAKRNISEIMLVIGMMMILLSIIMIFFMYSIYKADVLIYSFGMCILGICLIIFNSESVVEIVSRRFPSFYHRNLLLLSQLQKTLSEDRAVFVMILCLLVFPILFGNFSFSIYPNLMKYDIIETPYDVEFLQINNINKMKNTEIESIVGEKGIAITDNKEIKVLRTAICNILSASEVNRVFGTDYKVEKGKYIALFQFDPQDGYKHDLEANDILNFPMKKEGGDVQLMPAGQDIHILFNDNHALADRTIIVNDEEYHKIKIQCRYYYEGQLKMFSFDHWKSSKGAVLAVQQRLDQDNHLPLVERGYYELSSRILNYERANQSSLFLTSLMIFVIALFVISAGVIPYIAMKTHDAEDKALAMNLFRIGVTNTEIKRLFWEKTKVCFISIGAVAAMVAGTYSSRISTIYYGFGFGILTLLLGTILSFVLIYLALRFLKLVNDHRKFIR